MFLKAIILAIFMAIAYAGIFPSRFTSHFWGKLYVLQEVSFYFVLTVGAYFAAWIYLNDKISDTPCDNDRPQLKNIEDAEKWIVDRLKECNINLDNHGTTLLDHSLAVAKEIARNDPSRVARLAALLHDIGKTIGGHHAYHDKLSAFVASRVRFLELTEEEQDTLMLAVKYYHDDYVPDMLSDRTKELIANLKLADMAVTGLEKISVRLTDDELKEKITDAFHMFMQSVDVNNQERVSVISSDNICAVTEMSLTSGVLNMLDEKTAISIGASVKRAPRKLHPAFIKIRDALGDLILYEYSGIRTNNGLYNLRSGRKVIHAVVLVDRTKLPYDEQFDSARKWPYELKVLPWQE